MTRLSIADSKATEILSVEETKMIIGGESDKWFVGIITESGMASCWYTRGSAQNLADRVYPGQIVKIESVGCDNGGCHMN